MFVHQIIKLSEKVLKLISWLLTARNMAITFLGVDLNLKTISNFSHALTPPPPQLPLPLPLNICFLFLFFCGKIATLGNVTEKKKRNRDYQFGSGVSLYSTLGKKKRFASRGGHGCGSGAGHLAEFQHLSLVGER